MRCTVRGKLFALDNGHVLSIAVFDAVTEIIGIPNGGYLVYENQFIMRWRRLVIDIDHDTSSFEIFDLCVALELLAFVCNHDNSSPRAFARTNAINGSGGHSVLYACMGGCFCLVDFSDNQWQTSLAWGKAYSACKIMSTNGGGGASHKKRPFTL